jgi:nitrilase
MPTCCRSGTAIAYDGAGLAKAERLIGEVMASGAKLAVLPEAFLTGYPKGAFGTLSWGRGARRAGTRRHLRTRSMFRDRRPSGCGGAGA